MNATMLSMDIVRNYLDNIVKLPNWESTLKADRFQFLRVFLKQHVYEISFQNISMAAIDEHHRRAPDQNDIILRALKGKGGCCIDLNYFGKLLLEALGFDAFVIQGTHFSAPVAGTHCMLVVRMNNDELYMLEIGGSFPNLEPIPLFNLPHRFQCTIFPNEIRETPEGVQGRYQINGGVLGPYVGKTEQLRTSWIPTPKTLPEFQESMTQVFTSPTNSSLLRNPMLFRYLECGNLVDNPKFIFIWKYTVVIGDRLTREETLYESYDEMIPVFKKYFPKLSDEEIERAVDVFKQFEVKPVPYDQIL